MAIWWKWTRKRELSVFCRISIGEVLIVKSRNRCIVIGNVKTLLKDGQKYDFYVKREYSLFQSESVLPGYIKTVNYLAGLTSTVRLEAEGMWANWYVIKDHMKICVDNSVKLIESLSFDKIKKEIEELDTTGEAIVAVARQVSIEAQKKDADLQALLLKFWDAWQIHLPSLWRTFIMAEAGNLVFKKIFDTHVPIDLQAKALSIYFHPTKKAHLIHLAEVLAKEKDTENRIAYIRKNYPWIFSTDLYSSSTTDEQYAEYARTFTEPKEIAPCKEELLPKELTSTISMLQEILFIKDHRDEFRRRAFYNLGSLVEEITKKYDIRREDLWLVKHDELLRLENDREHMLRDIAERRKCYVVETDGTNSLFLQGEEALKNSLEDRKGVEATNVIKGISGAFGKVSGIAQVIGGANKIKEFKEGNVLVVTTTNPDYISAMQKAIAFVTDEGGITCHAAIVARELKKPCIVGTKNATKIIKDGDMVEVDADNGVVRILK